MTAQTIQWLIDRMLEVLLSSFRSWDTFVQALARAPKVFVNFSDVLAWPYLLSSLAVAWVLYLLAKRSATTPAASFRDFVFPASLYRHRSATLDFRFMGFDLLGAVLLYVPIYTGIRLLGTKIVSATVVDGLSWNPPQTLSPAAVVLSGVGFVLLFDLVSYGAHVWLHKSPILWSFHQVHHSAEVLTPASAYRVHPVENIVVAILQAPAVCLSLVFYQNIIGSDREFFLIGGVTVIGFACGLLGTHLRHSHIWLSFGSWWNRILISPAHHQIHHSIESRHWDKNFGSKFTFWDAMFGTLYAPGHPERFRIGLPRAESQNFTAVWKLYLAPFVSAAKHVSRSLPGKQRGEGFASGQTL